MAENDPWNVTQEEVDATFSNASKNAFTSQETVTSSKKSSGEELGIISLTFGILSFFCGLPFSIVGIVLGVLQNRNKKTSYAKAGIICSIISLVLGVIFTILALVFSFALLPQLVNSILDMQAYF